MDSDESAKKEALALIEQLSQALIGWTSIPPAIVQLTKPQVGERTLIQQLLVRFARKLNDDLGAAVILIQQGFTGPPYALIRTCRENVLAILYLAEAPQEEAERYAKYASETTSAGQRLYLHNLATELLNEYADKITPSVRSRLQGATLDAEALAKCQQLSRNAPRADYSLKSLVKRLVALLEAQAGNEASAFILMLIDYWIESEVTHGGFSAIQAYHIGSGQLWRENFDHLQDLMAHLLDLSELATFTTRAMVRGFGIDHQMPRPPASGALAQAARAADEFLRMYNTRQA